ncbi:MAG: hypothetical protein H0V34_03865 [Gammaproteobacteria bacterium]|nr:hypothetical protein [Gammaproteobacteria bacterium]
MLWDCVEANGYAHGMTDDPLPNTPEHKVLMNVAFGDHHVTKWAADIEARGREAHADARPRTLAGLSMRSGTSRRSRAADVRFPRAGRRSDRRLRPLALLPGRLDRPSVPAMAACSIPT